MNEEADGRLVARCCAGDRRAFADLVSRYQKPIYNAAMHMLHHTEDARDVTQTVFLNEVKQVGRLADIDLRCLARAVPPRRGQQ